MNKLYILAIVLLVSVTIFLKNSDKEKTLDLERVGKGSTSKLKKVNTYLTVKKLLDINKEEFHQSINIDKKSYLISTKKRAIKSTQYKTTMGKFIKEKSGFIVYELKKNEEYSDFLDHSLPVMRRKSKPLNNILTGKVVVRSQELSKVKDYFEKNGFNEVDRLERMKLAVYQAPSGKPLNALFEITKALPIKASLTWEILASPVKLR